MTDDELLKECALAFAQSKPTEWDHFRQEWFTRNLKTEVTATIPVSLEPSIVQVEEEPKPRRSRALRQEETE